MKEKIIGRGAEAVLIKTSPKALTKKRVEKSYRLPQLDEKIRKLRTRREARILEKSIKLIPTPKVISANEKTKEIQMQFIPGKKLSEHLESLAKTHKTIYKKIGKHIALLHNTGIIHGDLTTSNMILHTKEEKPKLYFIDFGISFHSHRVEDKAVDLHLIRQALEAKHPTIYKKAFKEILESYSKHSTNSKEILKRLEKVERRGRYKEQH